MNIEETIFFYTRNDYLIINNLLCDNISRVWEVAEIVNNDSKWILKAHEDGVNILDEESIKKYQNRVYEELDDKTKAKILNTDRNDISNILSAMKPAENEIMLYRTVWHARTVSAVSFVESIIHYSVNDTVEFKNISPTSIAPYREDVESDFYRYEITVPKGSLILELDQFNSIIRNEDGEFLLPPMKCKVKNILNSDNKNCKGIIELEYIGMLKQPQI